VTHDLLTRPALEERGHRLLFVIAFAVLMTGTLYWMMALMAQFAVMANGVQMEADPAMMAFIGSVLFAVGAPVTLVFGGWWVEVRRIGGTVD
jgi:hypothetical protein